MNKSINNESFDLLYILKVLKKGLKYIIILFVAFAVIAYGFSAFFITPKYSSNIRLYVTNTNNQINTNSINTNDISAAQQLAETYIVILKDPSVMEQVTAKLTSDITPSQLNGMVSFTTVGETEVINIAASTADPELSAEICNVYSEIAPEVLERVVKAGAVETIGEPKVAKNPSSPNKTKNALIGGIAGIALAVAIIFLKDVLDNTVQNEDQFKEKIDIPVWGSIPAFNKGKKRKKRQDPEKLRSSILNSKTSFSVTEAYKNARTSMSFAVTDEPVKVVAISSSEPNAGKSTTTANLAITLSKTNAKVLIIDADLRKPLQHKLFKCDNQKGLSGVLAGHYPVSECIEELAKNLYLMPSGVIPPNPSELLSSQNMVRLINEIRSVYDYVIIDTPPVNVVTDAAIITSKLDGMIFVVREGQSEYPDIVKAINSIQRVDGKVLGVILTDVNDYKAFGSTKYRTYYYKYGYSYGNSQKDGKKEQ